MIFQSGEREEGSVKLGEELKNYMAKTLVNLSLTIGIVPEKLDLGSRQPDPSLSALLVMSIVLICL